MREQPAWSARPEVIGVVEQALQENKAQFDHLVDTTEKTVDAINDFFIKTVTSAMTLKSHKTEGRSGTGSRKPTHKNRSFQRKEETKERRAI